MSLCNTFLLCVISFVGLTYVMSAKQAKLTGIHHFFKPAVEATSAAVDCDSRSDNDSTSTRSDTPSTLTCTHVEYVVENTLDKHHDDGGGAAGVAGTNLGGVAGDNGGGVAGDNEVPRLLVSDKPNHRLFHHRKQSHRNSSLSVRYQAMRVSVAFRAYVACKHGSDQHNHRSV